MGTSFIVPNGVSVWQGKRELSKVSLKVAGQVDVVTHDLSGPSTKRYQSLKDGLDAATSRVDSRTACDIVHQGQVVFKVRSDEDMYGGVRMAVIPDGVHVNAM